MINSDINLYPHTKTRPIIEYEAMYCFQNNSQNSLQIIQNKFIRCAYPCKQSTPIQTLHMIANIEPLNIRVNRLYSKYWFKAKFFSLFHPLNEEMHKFKNYFNSPPKITDRKKIYIPHNMIANNISHIKPNMKTMNGPIKSLSTYNIHIIPNTVFSPVVKSG